MAFTDDIKTEGQFWRQCIAALNRISGTSSGGGSTTGGATAAAQTDGTQKTQITDGTNAVAVATSNGDAQSNTSNRLSVNSRLSAFNGTTYDRVRAGVIGAVSSVTGYLNTLSIGKYNATEVTLTDGQSIETQLDSRGRVRVQAYSRSGMASANPTVSTSAYAAGEVVGTKMTFTAMVDAPGSGVFQSMRVNCKSVQTTALKFWVFNADPSASTFTDNAAPAIAAADYNKLIGVYSLSTPDSGLGTHTIWVLDGIGKDFTISSGTSLFGVLTCVSTPTLASTSDIEIVLNTMKD